MIGGIEERPEWVDAGVKLTNITKNLLESGSRGIAEYMDRIRPLWIRYERGERTQQLLEIINQL